MASIERILALCALVALPAISGCGTLYNVEFGGCCGAHNENSWRIYGGARHDLEAFATGANNLVTGKQNHPTG